MAMTDADREIATRAMIQLMFVSAKITANMSFADVKAAISAIDDLLDVNVSTLTQAQTIPQNMNAVLPEPFKSTATLSQKALVGAYVFMKRGGII